MLIEPVIDRAIRIEEQTRHAPPAAAPLVDRPTQRQGLAVGFVLLGAAWGLLFGLAAHLTRSWLSAAWSATRRALVLAALAGWTVSILPFLKYPANPPGVGEAETIAYRQALYFGFIALSIAGALGAAALHRRLASLNATRSAARRFAAPALYLLYAAGIYLLMPPNPDPIEMPPDLVQTFRAVSLAALVLFWVLLGLAFGWQVRDLTNIRARRPA